MTIKLVDPVSAPLLYGHGTLPLVDLDDKEVLEQFIAKCLDDGRFYDTDHEIVMVEMTRNQNFERFWELSQQWQKEINEMEKASC